jgi:hypothetical protein
MPSHLTWEIGFLEHILMIWFTCSLKDGFQVDLKITWIPSLCCAKSMPLYISVFALGFYLCSNLI